MSRTTLPTTARTRRALLLVAAVVGASCAQPRYAYEPATLTSADLAPSATTVSYPLPLDARGVEGVDGDVHVATFGITERATSDGRSRSRALRMALVVSNRGLGVWKVDVSKQEVQIPQTTQPVRSGVPAFGTSPTVIVPPRSSRWVDVYFLLPSERDEENELGVFDFLWTVEIEGRAAVPQRTRFERRPAGGQRPDVFTPAPAPLRFGSDSPGTAPR